MNVLGSTVRRKVSSATACKSDPVREKRARERTEEKEEKETINLKLPAAASFQICYGFKLLSFAFILLHFVLLSYMMMYGSSLSHQENVGNSGGK